MRRLPTVGFAGFASQAVDDQTIFPFRQASTRSVAHFQKLGEMGGMAMIVIRDFMTAALMDDICRTGADLRIAVVGEQGEFARCRRPSSSAPRR